MDIGSSVARASISLDGGRVSSLEVGGHELMSAAMGSALAGMIPLAPWAGVLPFGRLNFDGERHEFPLTNPPHARDGMVYAQRWSAMAPGVLQAALESPWPFGGFVRQIVLIDDGSLTVRMEVHAGEQPMPMLVGWQPWFRRQLDIGGPAKTTFDASEVYEMDADRIPTGNLVEAPAEPWDDCFLAPDANPTITWPGVLSLTLSSTFDHWSISTIRSNAISIGAQSGPPNQLNDAPTMVEPGSPLIGTMYLTWELAG